MDYSFNFWSNLIAIFSLIVSAVVALLIHDLNKRLSANDKFEHEKRINEEIRKIRPNSKVILADVKKYKPFRKDAKNSTYYKQAAELYSIIPEYGISVILRPVRGEDVPIGLVPYEWIELIREHDSEDNRPIIVCKFKGKKLYKNFKSPFKEIDYVCKSKV